MVKEEDVARALQLLEHLVGEERDPLATARALAPGGVFAWPYEPSATRTMRRCAGAWLRQLHRVRTLFVRVDAEGKFLGDSLLRGLVVALRLVAIEMSIEVPEGALREAVRVRCSDASIERE